MASEGSAGCDEWRIVLVGKTGAGKSSAGNTILGTEAFDSELSADSVTSDCKKERGQFREQKLAVIDTPGLYDTKIPDEDIWKKIRQCIGMSSPGPHAFLVVLQLGRFTDEEKQTVKLIQDTFGKDADKYMLVLFTYGDKLKKQSIEQFVSKSPELQNIIEKCHGRYHVFNNNISDPSQVSQLLEKIEKMIKDNGGSHYTTEMFVKAERAIEEEKERILKENEEKRRKEEKEHILKENKEKRNIELDEIKAKHEVEYWKQQTKILKEKYEAEARARAEAEAAARRNFPSPHRVLDVICVIL